MIMIVLINNGIEDHLTWELTTTYLQPVPHCGIHRAQVWFGQPENHPGAHRHLYPTTRDGLIFN